MSLLEVLRRIRAWVFGLSGKVYLHGMMKFYAVQGEMLINLVNLFKARK